MPYATPTDLENHVGADEYQVLADRDRSGSVDVEAVDKAIEDASSFADSLIYKYLPVTIVPAALRRAVCDLAVHDLAGSGVTEEQRRRRDDAERWLTLVASGKAALKPPVPETPEVDVVAEVVQPGRPYVMDELW